MGVLTINITVNNFKCQLSGSAKALNDLYEHFKFRHPNAFYVKRFAAPDWDGFIRLITDAGYIRTGLLPLLLDYCKEKEYATTLTDFRKDSMGEINIPKKIGPYEIRDYQRDAIKAVLNNYLGDDIYFPRGIVNAATNAGKTLIMAGIHLSFENAKTFIILNDKDLYNQFMTDMPQMFKSKDWGYMQGTNIKWGNIMVAMAQTLVKRLDVYKFYLEQYNIVLVDECDLADNKTYKTILSHFYNAYVKVGLSGSVFLRTLAKDKPKNYNIIGFFGNELYKIKNIALIERGLSTKPIVKIVPGNTLRGTFDSYEDEYHTCITTNPIRHQKALDRVLYYLNDKRYPILVVAKYHEHVHNLYEYFKKHLPPWVSIGYVHHKIRDRKDIIARFRDGEVDVLIASWIIKRGKNLPRIRYILNAGGGDGPENVLQIMGRGLRIFKGKEAVFIEDFMDEGRYLKRHSKHREIAYKNEKIKVRKLY